MVLYILWWDLGKSCSWSFDEVSKSKLAKQQFMIMEKSRSFPEYSCYSGGEFEDHRSNSYSFNGPKGDGFTAPTDPELKRKKRVASYNVFTMEGKLKSTVRNSFKWIKTKFTDIRHGV